MGGLRLSPRMSGCVVPIFGGVLLAGIIGVLYVVLSVRMSKDAPLARMYRAEADVAALRKALDTYHELHGAYPPGGGEGLRMATDALSRKVRYFPDGPPTDSWDRPFYYLPAPEYSPQTAFAGPDGFIEPETYQLFSAGADGDPGIDQADAQIDNITSWDATKGWRPLYTDMNAKWKADEPHAP